MSILFYCEGDDGQILQAFRQHLPSHVVVDWRNEALETYQDDITAAIIWKPPVNFFDGLPNLRDIYAFSAGVDHLLQHPNLPKNARIIRLRDAGMAEQMAEYSLYGVLYAQRQMGKINKAQREKVWATDIEPRTATSTSIGILGAGVLGLHVGKRLAMNGYQVSCWSRSGRHDSNSGDSDDTRRLSLVHGQEALKKFLSHSQIIICLLPLTESTRGILNNAMFQQLPRGAFLINPGRGDHLLESDLLDALETGQLGGALLDVFSTEPLAENHPFWDHPDIIMTPHIAAQSLVSESVQQIVANLFAVERGDTPDGLVDRRNGY